MHLWKKVLVGGFASLVLVIALWTYALGDIRSASGMTDFQGQWRWHYTPEEHNTEKARVNQIYGLWAGVVIIGTGVGVATLYRKNE